jgi:hypothetical protein
MFHALAVRSPVVMMLMRPAESGYMSIMAEPSRDFPTYFLILSLVVMMEKY